MEENTLLLEISEDIVAKENVLADGLLAYRDTPRIIKGTIFVICIKGNVEATLNHGRFVIGENDYVTLLHNSFLQIHSLSPDVCLSYVGFSQEIMHEIEFFQKAFDYLFAIFENPVKKINDKLALYMVRAISLWGMINELPEIYNNKEVLKSMMDTCLQTSIAMYHQDRLEDKWSKLPKKLRLSRQFLKLVTMHYKTERSISFYAELLNTTKENLCRNIKSCTNMTPLDVIDTLVLMDAKTQLRTTNTSIKEIGISLGFDNLATFCRFFRRHVGVSPMQYRDQ